MYQQATRPGHALAQVPESTLVQAERQAFRSFLHDCDGVRLLRWLTRESMTSMEQEALLERRLTHMPAIFARLRSMTALLEQLRAAQITLDEFSLKANVLFGDCKACPAAICARKQRLEQALRIRQVAPGEFAEQIARLLRDCTLREYRFPPGYVLQHEAAEIARARCALSEFRFREAVHDRDTPTRRQQVSRSDCPTLSARLCATTAQLGAVRRELQNKQEQIEAQRSRLSRLLCDRWPEGVRRPPDQPRWCAEVAATIQRLEQRLTRLTASAAALDDQLFSLARDYATAECEDFPGCLVGQP